MATVDELYTEVDAKTASHRVVIENQPVGEVLGIAWSFAIGQVPTATIQVPFPAPAIAAYFADVYIDVGFNGVMTRVFTGKVLNVANSETSATIECAGLSQFLERPSEDVAIGIDNETNLAVLDEIFAAAGIDYYTLALPSWTMGTLNPTVLTFQTFAEAVTRVAEIDGGRWAELPNGQIRVAVYDAIPAANVNRTYFAMNLTALAEAYPSDLTVADGRPRIRTVRRTPKAQDTKNRIHVRGATVTEEIAPGVEASHDTERTKQAPSIYVLAPDGSQAYNDLVFNNDLIDTFEKADEVALRLLALHNRLKIPLALTVEGDPLRQLGESVRVEDESYAGVSGNWFVEGFDSTLTASDFSTSLQLIGGVGAVTNLDPVAVFTWKAVWLVMDDDLYVMVTFDGRGSWDPDGTIVTYAWSDNQAPAVATGATPIINVCKKTVGVAGDIVPFWQVTLTVTDDDGNVAAVTQQIDLTLCDTPVNPNVVAPTIFAALENRYSASVDAGQTWYDQTGTLVISVAADPVNPVRAAYGRNDGAIYWTEDGLFTAPAVALAAVGSPIVSMTWDDTNLAVVWAVSQDARVYRSADYGQTFALYAALRPTLGYPAMQAGKVMATGAALLVFGGDGAGSPVVALDQFKNNTWTQALIGGELLADIAAAPNDLYIRDAAFNAGTQLWECAIILNSASFTPSVYYTTDLRGDGSEWTRCLALPAKSQGMWIAPDLTPDRFVFAYKDNAVYTGDVAAGVMTAAVAAATLDAGNLQWHGFWMGQFIPGMGTMYVVSAEGTTDGILYASCNRFATVGKIRPATGYPAAPAGADARYAAFGPVAPCPELYMQGDASAWKVARLSFNRWDDMGGDPLGYKNWHLINLNGTMYRIDNAQDDATAPGAVGGLQRANDIDANDWVTVIPYNPTGDDGLYLGVCTVSITADGILWAASANTLNASHLHVWKSVDDGLTWTRVWTGYETTGGANTYRAADFACDPLDPGNIVLSVARGAIIGGNQSRFIVSADGGATWVDPGSQMPSNPWRGHWVVFGDRHRVLDLVGPGLYVSDDLGASWVLKHSPLWQYQGAFLRRNPFNMQQFVYCSHHITNQFEIYVSRNNGEDWGLLVDNTALEALGWPTGQGAFSSIFLEDGSLAIAPGEGAEKVWRNADPFAPVPPPWQDITYNIGAILATGTNPWQLLASRRQWSEP